MCDSRHNDSEDWDDFEETEEEGAAKMEGGNGVMKLWGGKG